MNLRPMADIIPSMGMAVLDFDDEETAARNNANCTTFSCTD